MQPTSPPKWFGPPGPKKRGEGGFGPGSKRGGSGPRLIASFTHSLAYSPILHYTLHCNLHYTLLCTLHYTLSCTLHSTLHSALHSTLQCTLYFWCCKPLSPLVFAIPGVAVERGGGHHRFRPSNACRPTLQPYDPRLPSLRETTKTDLSVTVWSHVFPT